MAARIALSAYKGEDYEADGTHRVGDASGVVVDITGWTIYFTVRRKPYDATALLSVLCTVVSGTAGTYKVVLTAAQTLALSVGDYHCDFWRTDSGAQAEMVPGTFTILQPVRNP